MGKVLWKVGTYREQRFSPEKEGVVDWGAYYAAKTMVDREGNRILWGWIPETRSEAEYSAAGWAGVMALPRVVTLNAADEMQMEVAPTVRTLRDERRNTSWPTAAEARKRTLDGLRIHDLAAEVALECRPRGEGSFTLRLQSEDGASFATIRCVGKDGDRVLQVNDVKAAFPGESGLPVRLRMFLDGSVLEVFANDTTVITTRVYSVPASALRLAFEGEAELVDLSVWQLQPISKDRLTGSLCD